MIEEHCYQPGDQVEVDGEHYRLDRLCVVKKVESWYGWRESDGQYMAIPQPMFYTGYSETYWDGLK